MGVPQGRQRRLHPGAGPRRPGVRRRDHARLPRSTRVITKDGQAIGVALADGTELSAKIVVSALDPRRTFTQLVEPRELPSDLVENIDRFKFQGTSAKVNFALDGLPALPGAAATAPTSTAASPTSGPSMEYLERAFDDAKYGWYSKRPYIDGAIQSSSTPTWRLPASTSCRASSSTRRTTSRAATGTPSARTSATPCRRTLESFFPGFGDLVLHREVVTPLDIERVVGLTEGNIFAGEFFAPQMYFFRPAPGWSQYRTPIDGYYQCGSAPTPAAA